MISEKRNTPTEIEKNLFLNYPELCVCEEAINSAFHAMQTCFRGEHKLLIAGNGGSAADSEHISGELMKSFMFKRSVDSCVLKALTESFGEEGRRLGEVLEGALPALPLTSFPAITTAFSNDVSASAAFAQMVYGYGASGDVFLGISTSGESLNIFHALMVAHAKGIRTILLTGEAIGRCADICDIAIHVPARETFRIQEMHIPIYHTLCAMLEADMFVSLDSAWGLG